MYKLGSCRRICLCGEPYQHHWAPGAKYDEIFTGWAYPPRDYERWEALAYEWSQHCVEKFGKDEVERWYWEVWNEPNIGYWRGTPEEFRKLHDFGMAGVRRALPTAKVGGPDVAGDGGKFMRDFLEHCLHGRMRRQAKRARRSFVSFHAKQPEFVGGHVRMGIAEQLRTIDAGFKTIASFPGLRTHRL
jgi:xylan 1,4-beta-xylosidase